MKRTELKRKTPMKSGSLKQNSTFKNKVPVLSGSVKLARTTFKKKAPKKRAGHDKPVRDMCYGQRCLLQIHCTGWIVGVTVPCHTNELMLGKGGNLKAPDLYTVPGCNCCHAELDQGKNFTKTEKKLFWRNAYAVWGPIREKQFGIPYKPLPESADAIQENTSEEHVA